MTIVEKLGPERCKQIGKVFQFNELGTWIGYKDCNLVNATTIVGRLVSIEVLRNYGRALVVRHSDSQEVILYQ